MVAYNFHARFIVPICAKTKIHSVRKCRLGQAKVGSSIELYYAKRTKFSRLLGLAVCQDVRRINLWWGDDVLYFPDTNEIQCSDAELNAFATGDGFADWGDLTRYWRAMHPKDIGFEGDLITWGDTFAPPAPV